MLSSEEKRAKKAAGQKAWRDSHKAEIAAYSAAYRATHKEETAAYNAAYRKTHLEEFQAYQRAHAQRHRAILNRHKRIIGCSVCQALGQEPSTFLLYHHPGGGKVSKVTDLVRRKWSIIKAEVAKCVVMCNSHHVAQHNTERGRAGV